MDPEARVHVETRVAYGKAGDRELHADIYHPPAGAGDPPDAGWPAVVLVYGGAWHMGERSQLRGYGLLLAQAGYLCMACEYRLSPQARWPEHLHDVKAAVRWTRATAGERGVDPDRIGIHGNSAGGHLALLVAGTPDEAELEGAGGHEGVSSAVKVCTALYPPTLLHLEGTVGAEVRPMEMLTDEPTEALARQASPLLWAAEGFPPTMLVHGSADERVPVRSSRLMYDALARHGVPVELHVYPEQPHAFDADPRFGRRVAAELAFFLDRYL